jgi:hypothetical protein
MRIRVAIKNVGLDLNPTEFFLKLQLISVILNYKLFDLERDEAGLKPIKSISLTFQKKSD